MSQFARTFTVAVTLIALVGFQGCGSKQPATPVPPAAAAAESARVAESDNDPGSAEAPETAEQTAQVQSADTNEPANDDGPAQVDHVNSGDNAEPASPIAANSGDGGADPLARERFIIFAPRGPLLVEVTPTIDGQSYDQAMRRLVEQVLQDADTNGDGVPSWDEVIGSSKFKYGQYGNTAINTAMDERELRRQYDIDNDNRLDAGEVPRFLTQNMGRTRTLTLTSSNAHRGDNQSRSPVRLVLDHDDDGRLADDEITTAALRLRLYDSDGDDILVLNDFKARTNLDRGTPMATRRRYGPDSATLISQSPKWGDLAFSLAELYGLGGSVERESIPLVPRLFDALDGDGNGKLATEELESLLTIPPHISVAVHFGRNESEPLALEQLGLDFEEFSDRATERNGRISIDLGDCDLLFYVNDLIGNDDYQAQAASQLQAFDNDSNGYLDRKEFNEEAVAVLFSFEGLDSDKDGAIRRDEIAQFIAQRQAAAVSQIEVVAADQEDALFNALDTNGDSRLTTREIDECGHRLLSYDRNGDGQLAVHEIPGSLAVGFLRGSRGDNLPTAVPVITPTTELSGPEWFRSMDENLDGELSSREFFGSEELFQQLDRNGDGILGPNEVK